MRQQVNELVERGVLVRVEEPTAWVSQMAVTRKESDGFLRICIDPQPLNAVLMREHFKTPTLDDGLSSLHNARVFTKLDVKEAFWHVRLDEQSSLLTTMITPCGRFRWARLPFGLSVSSEIFQKRLTEALGGLKGVICVADDIIVIGRGDTQAEAEKDHSENLSGLQNRCKEKNIKLNDAKAAIHQDEISFKATGFQQKESNRIGRRLQQSSTCLHQLMSAVFEEFVAWFNTWPNLCQTSPMIWNQSGH